MSLFQSVGQNQALELTLGANRLDYQFGVGYSVKWSSFQLVSSLELGTSTTFIQGRFNPRMGVGFCYLLLEKDRLVVGPTIGYSYSFVQVNKISPSYHHWHEALFGYTFEYGDNWRLVHRAMGSIINERFKGQVGSSSESFVNFGFYVQVGVKYYW